MYFFSTELEQKQEWNKRKVVLLTACKTTSAPEQQGFRAKELKIQLD